MKKSRITALAVLPLSAVLLSGCGQVRAGAAALVGDDRITVSTLNRTVNEWQPQILADPQANAAWDDELKKELLLDPDKLSELDVRSPASPRRTLNSMIYLRLADRAAKDNGIEPSEGQVSQVIDLLNQNPTNLASRTLVYGLPTDRGRDVARAKVIELMLLDRFGADQSTRSPATQQAIKSLSDAFTNAARELKIRLNPRYGVYDPTRITIDPVVYRLSAYESGVR
ncbi:hypothetical protein [Actinomadura oligospora]|uniref:hypothetical protein n=1 Tax=Actinomadura oligospora TaxID=111804 RepID=UPI0004B85D9F|nr:hypothetical protein [Actinomadura oligospora]